MPGLAGTRIGHYRLKDQLGRGGMSEIYLADDVRIEREVAVKIVSNRHTDYIERFRREAETITTLHHPHILPALDYGEHEHWHYLVMPYIAHGTLREQLMHGPLTLEVTGVLLEQMASALSYAHEQGIIHRDIKPSNILMRDDRYAYLADFGLAKSLEGGSTITQIGLLLGTPEYMAPELAKEPANACSDLYALGIVLYQMVTGQIPFSGETPIACYLKQMNDLPTPPSHINPAVPPAIERVILRILDKTPQRRYQTANELAQSYITALTFPDQIEEEDISPSLLYNTTPLDERVVESVMQGEQGKKLVLPNAQYPAPAVISSQRSGLSSRVAPVVSRPTASRVQPSYQKDQKAQAPTRRRRARYRRSNRVLISMTVVLMMLVLVLALALILAFIFK